VSEPKDEANARPDVGAELGRLVATLQDWARRALPESVIGHGAECQWCPICQFVNVLRGEQPEVADRLTEAGAALAAAVKSLAESAVGKATGDGPRERPRPQPRVQRIDLDDPPDS
jgi:hypothetical protein